MTDANKPWTAGLTWHRADSARQMMLYTLMQEGWRKGEAVMVNDVSVTFRQDNKSATDLEPFVSMFLAAPDMAEALAWYGEQARLARLIHSEGDAGRHALAEDGGAKARAALQKARGGES